MPKSLTEPQLGDSALFLPGGLSLGMVWGGIAGGIIGTGVSLTIGLFSGSAVTVIAGIILVSAVLGGLFGHVLSSLLADDVSLTGRAVHQADSVISGQTAAPSDYMILKTEQETRFISNQKVMESINNIRSKEVSLPPYREDARIFELVVRQAHKTGYKAEAGSQR